MSSSTDQCNDASTMMRMNPTQTRTLSLIPIPTKINMIPSTFVSLATMASTTTIVILVASTAGTTPSLVTTTTHMSTTLIKTRTSTLIIFAALMARMSVTLITTVNRSITTTIGTTLVSTAHCMTPQHP